MRTRMNILSLLAVLVISLSTRSVLADPIIGFDPAVQTVDVGETFDVALTISGLGDLTAPSLGAYDLFVWWDPEILRLIPGPVSYGDPLLGDQLALTSPSLTITTGPARVPGDPGKEFLNLVELSFDLLDDLNTMQQGAFTLATLTFEAEDVGFSLLRFEGPFGTPGVTLGDASGNPLEATVRGGSVNVVPEPGTLLLVGSGLGGLALWRLRKRKI